MLSFPGSPIGTCQAGMAVQRKSFKKARRAAGFDFTVEGYLPLFEYRYLKKSESVVRVLSNLGRSALYSSSAIQ